MIEILAGAIIPGVLLWVEKRDRANAEEKWRMERSELLNRIKPETAQPIIGPVPESIPAVGFDDDRAWARAKGIEV